MEVLVGTQSLAQAVTYNATNDVSQYRKIPTFLMAIAFFVDTCIEVSELCETEMQGSGTHPGPNEDENRLHFHRLDTAPAKIKGKMDEYITYLTCE